MQSVVDELMLPSHCREFCLPTNTNWHLLRIAQHRIDSNYLVLVRCHFRISLQANTNVLKCSKHSYWPCKLKPIRIATYCIAERRINLCQFLVCISLLYIRVDSLYIRTWIRCLSTATQYIAIRCTTIKLSYWIAHFRIGSCKFLLVPVVFSSHHSGIWLILHHHRTALYCIVSPSCWSSSWPSDGLWVPSFMKSMYWPGWPVPEMYGSDRGLSVCVYRQHVWNVSNSTGAIYLVPRT